MNKPEVELRTFPDSDYQALAMLYTQNQDLKGKSPIEIATIYFEAYYEITYQTREIRSDIRNKHRG